MWARHVRSHDITISSQSALPVDSWWRGGKSLPIGRSTGRERRQGSQVAGLTSPGSTSVIPSRAAPPAKHPGFLFRSPHIGSGRWGSTHPPTAGAVFNILSVIYAPSRSATAVTPDTLTNPFGWFDQLLRTLWLSDERIEFDCGTLWASDNLTILAP